MTLILGAEGSMGRRYQAILKHLGVEFRTFDVKENLGFGPNDKDLEIFSHFIIATPTETHKQWVKRLDKFEKPILCEKPLSKKMDEVEFILSCKSPITMQMQYRYYDHGGDGFSWYDYYNHGKDGIVWDCFQVVALAKGKMSLREGSPIWTAGLNGSPLDISKMDFAYIWAVKNFYDGNYLSREDLLSWHKKVADLEALWIM